MKLKGVWFKFKLLHKQASKLVKTHKYLNKHD